MWYLWRAYTHKTTPHNEIWKCSLSVTKGKEACQPKQVPDKNKNQKKSNKILNKRDLMKGALIQSWKGQYSYAKKQNKLVFQMKDGTSKRGFLLESKF